MIANSVPIDPYLENATDWGSGAMRERAKLLGATGYKKIWWI
jgi:hypothetical protein